MVVVMRANLCNDTSLVPLAGVLAALVLNSYLVIGLEGLERFAGIRHLLTLCNVSFGISSSASRSSLSPLLARLKLSWLERQEILENTSEYYLSWGQARHWARVVSVG